MIQTFLDSIKNLWLRRLCVVLLWPFCVALIVIVIVVNNVPIRIGELILSVLGDLIVSIDAWCIVSWNYWSEKE